MKNIKSPSVVCEQLHQKIRALLEELTSIPSDDQPKAIIHHRGRRGDGGHGGRGGHGGHRGCRVGCWYPTL